MAHSLCHAVESFWELHCCTIYTISLLYIHFMYFM